MLSACCVRGPLSVRLKRAVPQAHLCTALRSAAGALGFGLSSWCACCAYRELGAFRGALWPDGLPAVDSRTRAAGAVLRARGHAAGRVEACAAGTRGSTKVTLAGVASRQLLGAAAGVSRDMRGLCVPRICVLSQNSLACLVWARGAPGNTARQQPRRLEGTVE